MGHNPKVGGSNPPPATKKIKGGYRFKSVPFLFFYTHFYLFIKTTKNEQDILLKI